MIKEMNWELSVSDNIITDIIEKNKEYFKNAGGDIEILISKCKMVHAKRVFTLDRKNKFILTKDDIHKGFEMMKKYRVKEKSTLPPIGMYM